MECKAPARDGLAKLVRDYGRENDERYTSHLNSSSPDSPLNVPVVGPAYSDQSPSVDGRQVLVRNFDANFARDPRIFVIGEDIGRVGDVDLVFEGLQAKGGEAGLTATAVRGAAV